MAQVFTMSRQCFVHITQVCMSKVKVKWKICWENSFPEHSFTIVHSICITLGTSVGQSTIRLCVVYGYDPGLFGQGHRPMSNQKFVSDASLPQPLTNYHSIWHKCAMTRPCFAYMIQVRMSKIKVTGQDQIENPFPRRNFHIIHPIFVSQVSTLTRQGKESIT